MTERTEAPRAGSATPANGLQGWFSTVAGAAVAAAEAQLAAVALSDLFGYHLVQLGRPHEASLLAGSRISHHITLGGNPAEPGLSAYARSDALPLQAATVDVLVLPHGLEFADDPHGVLREAERVLIPEGYLLVFAFNPWSLFGLWRLFSRWRGEYPWRGRFVRPARLKDWLAVLGFEVVNAGGLSFRPPLRDPGWFARLAWMERPAAYFLPRLGNVYWILARKRVPAARPIRALRARRRRLRATVAESPLGQRRNEIKDPDDGR